jgi:hypothetical protein
MGPDNTNINAPNLCRIRDTGGAFDDELEAVS